MRIKLLMVVAGMLAATSPLSAGTFYLYGGGTMTTNSTITSGVLQFVNPGSSCSSPNTKGYCQNDNYSASFGTGTGNIDIYDNGASSPIVGLVIQATFNASNIGNFNSGNADWYGNGPTPIDVSYGQVSGSTNGDDLEGPTGTRLSGSGTTPITSAYSSGYYVYFYISLASYEGSAYDVSGYSGVNSSGQLTSGNAVAIPYSFVTLPANVIFNVYGVQTCSSGGSCLVVSTTNANSSTYGIGECLSCPANVPEPTTLLLLASGLTGMILRRRLSV